MNARLLFPLIVALLLGAQIATAQPTDDPVDTTGVDSTWVNPDDIVDPPFNDDIDNEPPPPSGFGAPSGGIRGGFTVELSQLEPSALDPALSGDMVMWGGQGYIILSGWLFGGMGVGATVYDLNPVYDQFAFGYGGFLTGYQFKLFGDFDFRIGTMIGTGGLSMIKKRPDIQDSTVQQGHEILERYRDESFFALQPTVSIGFSPIGFVNFRLAANYLMPFGGSSVSDLRKASFGLHVMFGFTQQ